LGGADCVDRTARANLDLLWKCLDELEEGEPDLLGSGLDAAIEKLNAQPDPAASSERGVQLMSIHKSKGLEFEVVIVPDLHAGSGRGERRLLSWLERGLDADDESGDITEFLVAPLPSKGAESGKCKSWVDRERRARETQEMRRILYVVATRAREELHLFARPEYKTENDGSYTLCDPRDSLLATAWPAVETEIRRRFDNWIDASQDFDVVTIAAAGADNLVVMPSPARPAILRRLPNDYQAPEAERTAAPSTVEVAGLGSSQLYQRHEGEAVSRALGSAVHALFEEFARLRANSDWPEARDALRNTQPRILAQLRRVGMEQREAANVAAQAMDIAIRASHDPAAQWILSPHPESASEVCWAGLIAGALREVRVDRVFRAGTGPASDGEDCWWIVDYKTAHESSVDPAALAKLRALFAPQLEFYAQVLRNLRGRDVSIRAGLYYPRMSAFDWWEL
jgi:ATP-dependent exoDNAse (exonuclease V) beta subunit